MQPSGITNDEEPPEPRPIDRQRILAHRHAAVGERIPHLQALGRPERARRLQDDQPEEHAHAAGDREHEQRDAVGRPRDVQRRDREQQHGDALSEAADAAQRQLVAEQLEHRRARPQQEAIEVAVLDRVAEDDRSRARWRRRCAQVIEIMP